MTTQFQRYNTATNTYSRSQNVPREKPLNGFTVTNIGDTAFTVNGVRFDPPVAPATVGNSVSFGGNEGEIFSDRIYLSFLLPLGANPLCEIVQKFYITDKDYQ